MRLKSIQQPNSITFVLGGGCMTVVGIIVALAGVAYGLVVYLSRNGMVWDAASAFEVASSFFPCVLVLFGIILTAVRPEYIIDGDRQCYIQANKLWSLPGFSQTTPREEISCVTIQRIKNVTVNHEDWCDIWIERKASQEQIFSYSKVASEELESLAQRMANLLDVPLVEKEIDLNDDVSD